MGLLMVATELFHSLGVWWNGANARSESLVIESMDDPGWMLRYQGNSQPLASALNDGYRRSPHDWLRIESGEQTIALLGGPLALGEIIWRFLELMPISDLNSGSGDRVPLNYFHGFGIDEPLDLCTRIIRWYLPRCDYDWEHSDGLLLSASGEDGWSLTISGDDDLPLGEKDRRVLFWPEQTESVTFWKEDHLLMSRCDRQNLPVMLHRALEWLERDWEDTPGLRA